MRLVRKLIIMTYVVLSTCNHCTRSTSLHCFVNEQCQHLNPFYICIMPTLKQITCSVVVGGGEVKINEYGHIYNDGAVECFIPVPGNEASFHIHLYSTGYIAPGIAVFVYIDGKYQCNRNKPSTAQRNHRIDLQLRQKEDKLHTGDFVGRGWSFTDLKRGAYMEEPPYGRLIAETGWEQQKIPNIRWAVSRRI